MKPRRAYKAQKVLFGKYEGEESLGRPSHRWEDNSKIDHKGRGYEGVR
jgi:hypothetical protein